MKTEEQSNRTATGLIQYPVPLGDRMAYLQLPTDLTAADVERLRRVMLTLTIKRKIKEAGN